MGRSLIKLAILAALVVFSWRLLLQAPPSRSQDEYVAALIDKDELLGSTLGPRFLFVGGSNLAFGLDSTMVEEAAGLPVVNCGLHANLGLQFMLNRARIHLTEGDIVVLCPEYDAPPQINPDLLIYLASVGIHPRQGDISSSWSQSVRFACARAQFTSKNVCRGCPAPPRFVADPVYRRSGFDRHGDLTSHLSVEQEKRVGPWKYVESAEPRPLVADGTHAEIIALLNSFAAAARAKNARVYYLGPPIPESRYAARKHAFAAYDQRMRRELEIPILSAPEDFVLPDDKFFDSNYHLNRAGRRLRTEKIIAKLLEALPR